jgi:hypothetical protein
MQLQPALVLQLYLCHSHSLPLVMAPLRSRLMHAPPP